MRKPPKDVFLGGRGGVGRGRRTTRCSRRKDASACSPVAGNLLRDVGAPAGVEAPHPFRARDLPHPAQEVLIHAGHDAWEASEKIATLFRKPSRSCRIMRGLFRACAMRSRSRSQRMQRKPVTSIGLEIFDGDLIEETPRTQGCSAIVRSTHTSQGTERLVFRSTGLTKYRLTIFDDDLGSADDAAEESSNPARDKIQHRPGPFSPLGWENLGREAHDELGEGEGQGEGVCRRI